MEFLGAIVGKVLELTVETIGSQLGYLIYYHRNMGQLKDEFRQLQFDREAKQHLIDAARRNGEEIEVKVQYWFTKVDKITEKVEKFNEKESHVKTGCSYKPCPNLWLRHQLSKEAKNIKLEVAKIQEESNFEKVSFNEPPQWEDLSSTGIEKIESRISTMNDVLKALVDSNVNMIGLCGLGGVGKTTLATKVIKKVKEENLFDMVVMVKVAQHQDLKEIQRQIAEKVGMKFKVETESIRASRLYYRLKQEKKLLVVLDDLWERLDLGLVGIPFDFDEKRKNSLDDENDKHYTKILLISRNEELLFNQMKCKKIIRVDVLSESEAWELFKEKAELPGNPNYPILLTVAAEIAERCSQLPLAIVAVARALREKGLSEWRDNLQRLKNPLRRNIVGINEVDSSLRLSYDSLNSEEFQSVFLLSAMLSRDPSVIDLLMYSMGLSLLQDIHSMEEARDGLDALVNMLKASNLLRNSFSNDHFTMHDVIRNFALSIASKEQHALVVRHEKQYELIEKNIPKGCTRLCLDKCDITKLSEELCCPKLEFFLLDNKVSNLRIPSMFFKSMQELKVVNFTNMHFSSLPSSLFFLQKVKTLCLHSCILEDIVEVGKLKNLEVLSLAYSIIKRLPSELGGLTCLKMLNLAHCFKLEVIPQNLLSSLKSLEVLNMENSFNQWGAKGSSKSNDNASLTELKHLPNLSSLDICIPNAFTLPKDLFLGNSLNRYRIFIGQDWEWSDQYKTSKTLKLKLESSIYLEPEVQKLLESVEDLYLDQLCEIDNVIYDLDNRGFHHLKHLWIHNNEQIEYVIKSTGLVDAFLNLETLNLHNLNGLKKLCQGGISTTSFQKLSVIKVIGCHHLEVLFSMSMVGLFSSLVEIHIRECKSIKEIVVSTKAIIFHQLHCLEMVDLPSLTDFFFDENATNNDDSQIFKPFFNNKVSFPNLEILEMCYLNIEYIWNDQLLHNSFSNLKTLIVEHCQCLVKLISLQILKCLSNLEELRVKGCGSLEMVFDFEELKRTNKEIHSVLAVPLKKLELSRLPKLKHVWSNNSKGIVKFHSLQHVSFPNLEILEMCYLNIEYIWNDQLLHNSFSNLKTLLVEHCHCLVKLISLQILKCLKNLEELRVKDCDSLEMVFDFEELKSSNKEKHSLLAVPLKKLEVSRLPKLKHVWSNDPKEIVSFQSLRHVSAYLCESLTSMFPTSIAKSLLHLEELSVRLCGIEVIVAKDEVLESFALTFLFPKLTSLQLHSLDNMKNFYPHTHSLRCPRLQELYILYCDELEIFQKEMSSSSKLQKEEAHTKYLLFFQKKQIPNLEKLTLSGKHAMMIWNGQFPAYHFHKVRVLDLNRLPDNAATFSYSLLRGFPNLEELDVQHSSIQEMFSCTEALGDVAGQIAPLRTLTLLSMEKLKHIWNEHSQMDLFLPNLESLKVTWCSALINLGPSSVSLKNLIDLEVSKCNRLLYLLTSSTARCLVQLTRLKIIECSQIKEIITKQGEDVEKEIVLKNLKHLELYDLPHLKNFCSPNNTFRFPLLNEASIDKCPNLKGIEIISNEKRSEVNFNKTIILL